jgi:hypothetical protein
MEILEVCTSGSCRLPKFHANAIPGRASDAQGPVWNKSADACHPRDPELPAALVELRRLELEMQIQYHR